MSSLLRSLFNGSSKHKKLSEEWATIREPVVEGVTFYCKYLGSTMVDDPKGEAATAEAIKRIIQTAKQVARKPERVALHVSLQGIKMEDSTTSDLLLQTSIYKISYCSADAHYDHVFAFIATSDDDTCECHAFLCPKRKMAQAVTVSIAQAFNLAYECWKMSLDKNNGEIYAQEELPAEVTVGSGLVHSNNCAAHSQPSSCTSSPIPIRSDFGSSDMSTSGYQSSTQALLIDLDDSSEQTAAASGSSSSTQHCSTKTTILSKPLNAFDDLSEVSDDFSRLALRRENPRLPHLPGTSQLTLAELDLAAFTAPPPASPTGNGFWPLANFPVASLPSPTSPMASSPSTTPMTSSPTDPWFLGQSPPEEVSRSPNTAFLHSCQSPPSHTAFSTFMQAENKVKPDPFSPADGSGDQFLHEDQVIDLFSSSSSNHSFRNTGNPFLSSQHLNPFLAGFSPSQTEVRVVMNPASPQLPPSSCGSVQQPAWNGELFQGRKGNNVICS